jgi:hypothetical protein
MSYSFSEMVPCSINKPSLLGNASKPRIVDLFNPDLIANSVSQIQLKGAYWNAESSE